MMNCIPSPGRDRYNARVFDPSNDDDDDSVQEFYRAHPCLLEKEKAQHMESTLGDAISMAERSSGSLLVLQQLNQMNAVDLGRRMSTFRSMGEYEETKEGEMPPPQDLGNMAATLTASRSMQSVASLPTFLKVERGTPAVLTQKSWETISRTDSETDEEEQELSRTKAASVPVTPSRSWNKLRQTFSNEERNAAKEQKRKKQSKRSSSSALAAASTARASPLRLFSRKKTDETSQSFAKNAPVEVSLRSEKKKGWGGRLRRRNNDGQKGSANEESSSRKFVKEALPLTPALIPMELSREAEENDFLLDGSSTPRDLSMEEEEQKLEEPIHYNELPVVPLEQSMEVMNHGSCFDIIGASNIFKGLETSWKELTEDSFDVVPRPQ